MPPRKSIGARLARFLLAVVVLPAIAAGAVLFFVDDGLAVWVGGISVLVALALYFGIQGDGSSGLDPVEHHVNHVIDTTSNGGIDT